LHFTPIKLRFLPKFKHPVRHEFIENFLTVNMIGKGVLIHFIGKIRRCKTVLTKIHKI